MTTTFNAAYDDGDVDTNSSANLHLNELVVRRLSRRRTLTGGLQAAAAAVFGGALLSACGDDAPGLPTASVNAGDAVATSAGKTVILNGSVTGGDAGGAGWSQVSGPAVTLVNANSAKANFTAPGVVKATPLVFRFATADSAAQADTTVTVGPAELGFTPVAKNLSDVVTVPDGYAVTVLYRLGDPIAAGVAAYSNAGTDTNFAQRAGDHHDGMSYFGLSASGTTPDPSSSTRGLLVLNHENITQSYLHPDGPTAPNGVRPEAEALKEMEAHGVSVIEVTQTGGTWSYVQAGALNRRVTPLTPTEFSGPVRGDPALRTVYSPVGTAGRGTINNCANGTMPWQTYLTNEENWAGYFRRERGDAATRDGAGFAKENVSLARYGIPEGRGGNYGWTTVMPADPANTTYARWNITANPNAASDGTQDFRHEAFQYGWVVEIDPFNASATPRKRTALGRLNHEGCQAGRMIAGVRPAFYMGDDARGEYIYKFVSATPWSATDADAADRLAIGDKYLNSGTLYVAKFREDGSGIWLPLTYGTGPLTGGNAAYPFTSQADVLINARLAADAVGATPMDRPEWTAVNPATGEMYCTLTNNSQRTAVSADAANPRAYADPSTAGRTAKGNANGHVIRLREGNDSSESTGFAWDIYAFGAGSDLDPQNINLSGLDATNDFSSPDGLWFGLPENATGQGTPIMWIETDDGAYTDVTNCMLLAGIPGQVGDGRTRAVANSVGGNSMVTTRMGKAPGATLRRFLVGPKECEITGIHTTPDGRALFVNIQHPGEDGGPANITSNWPASQSAASAAARPRSATIVITRNDGELIGL